MVREAGPTGDRDDALSRAVPRWLSRLALQVTLAVAAAFAFATPAAAASPCNVSVTTSGSTPLLDNQAAGCVQNGRTVQYVTFDNPGGGTLNAGPDAVLGTEDDYIQTTVGKVYYGRRTTTPGNNNGNAASSVYFVGEANGNVSVSFETVDSAGAGLRITYAFTATGVVPPSPPTANSQSVTTAFNTVAPITLTASNSPTSFTVTNPAHGFLTGNAPNVTYNPDIGYSGPDSFNFTATNGAGTSAPATVSITVSPRPVAISPATIANGSVGLSYSQTFTASGGTSPYTFAITAGALPSGLSLSSGGVLSGTPTAGGDFTFTVRATDNASGSASRSYTFTIAPATITVAPNTLPNATFGTAYSQTITASGGTAPYTFAVVSGDERPEALPSGLTLSTAGLLSGTPTAAGTFSFSVRATDSSFGTGPYNGIRSYTITVAAPTIALAPTTLPAAAVATAYSQTLTTSGGTAPYTYAITAGALPAGLTLATNGTLSGTPTAGGTFTFTATATDSSSAGTGGPFTGNRSYTLAVAPATITVAPTTLPNGVIDTFYSQTISASGGTAPYSFAVASGAIPTGLALSSDGVLTGKTTASGTFNFTVAATDSSSGTGPYSGNRAYSVTIAPAIAITPTTLPDGTEGVAYNQTLTTSGGTAPYTYAVTAGALPDGLSLSTGGALTGTPTDQGTYNFTVSSTDSAATPATATQDYIVTIAAPVAGSVRTWVSGVGDDANPCTRTAPCLTFAAAILRTATGGEINCLDSGGFGTLTITKSVSIVCPAKGARAGVIASGGNAITIDAPATASIVIDGVDFEGIGNSSGPVGVHGVRFVAGGSLIIRNSTFRGFRGGYAIDFEPGNAALLQLDRVSVADSGGTGADTGGILVRPTGSGIVARATITRSAVSNNQQSGIRLESASGSGAQIYATLDHLTLNNNTSAGLIVRGVGGAIQTTLTSSTSESNGFGIITNGASSVTTVADTTVTRNGTGVLAVGGGSVRSLGGNSVVANTSDGTFTASTPRQ